LSRRRFFVAEFRRGEAVIEGERAHHLYHVLRVRRGETFELSDTARLYRGRVVETSARMVKFALEEELPAPPPLPEVTLLAAVFKFDRFEWMIEKATELGVTRIVPVVAARTDAGLGRGAAGRVDRWRRIVLEAAQQCRRLAPPEVAPPATLTQAVTAGTQRPCWLLDETAPGGAPAGAPARTILSGPEGGLTGTERESAAAHGFTPVRLGPLILRAETAPLAALAVVAHLRLTAGNPLTMEDA